ncbi:DUF2135 domain-containing protein [Candidatus Magnetaquicoccus inordinatus]|uniref:DUF2135 domain-containing protein n=1 Tax=Candidatus Magnetaquicoccus inordinatus TaxID=2496818 RepID=UPI00102AE0A1|nr:DUF2135 domain-containing protein [Candidatus Magnetaquicoccus inordinatus]
MKRWMVIVGLLLLPSQGETAGFSCAQAATAVERWICQDAELSAADTLLEERYKRLLASQMQHPEEQAILRKQQLQWLRESRNRCLDVQCLQLAYQQRNLSLQEQLPQPLVLDGPSGGWRNGAGEEPVSAMKVSYPASGVNSEEENDLFASPKGQAALIRGRIASSLLQKEEPWRLVVNGVPMPLQIHPDGSFERPYLFGNGSNSVEIRSPDGKQQVRRQFYEAYAEQMRPRLRILLSWDTPGTDLDLHVITPLGEHCAYFQRSVQSGGALDVDVTTGYGPEIFSHPAPPPGLYLVYLNYYGGGGDDQQPTPQTAITVATVTIVREEGTADESQRSFTIPMRRPGELLEVAQFIYP